MDHLYARVIDPLDNDPLSFAIHTQAASKIPMRLQGTDIFVESDDYPQVLPSTSRDQIIDNDRDSEYNDVNDIEVDSKNENVEINPTDKIDTLSQEIRKQICNLLGIETAKELDKIKNVQKTQVDQEKQNNYSRGPGIGKTIDQSPKMRGGDVTALKVLIDIIPVFTGRNISIQTFAKECRFALDGIDQGFHPLFVKLLRSKIQGEADLYLKNRNFSSLEEILYLLQKAFGTPKTIFQIESEVAHVKQDQGETILAYGARVMELYNKMVELTEQQSPPEIATMKIKEFDSEVATCFLLGLRGDIEGRVRQKNPSNLQEAINAAMESEKELKRRKRLHHELNDYSKETINKEFKGKDYLIKEKFRRREGNPEYSGVYHVNEKSSRDVDFSKKICYTCGKEGHIARNCDRSGDSRQNLVCYTCGEDGHTSRNCAHRNINSVSNARKVNKSKIAENNKSMKCSYCHEVGHQINTCFKRRMLEAERRADEAERALKFLKREKSSKASTSSENLNLEGVHRQGAGMNKTIFTVRQSNAPCSLSGKRTQSEPQ